MQLAQFRHLVSPDLHQKAAAEAERLRLEAEAEQRAAAALQGAGQEAVSTAQACAEALTARRARTKADPESDDDELIGAALDAERRSAFYLESRTNSWEDDLTHTGSH